MRKTQFTMMARASALIGLLAIPVLALPAYGAPSASSSAVHRPDAIKLIVPTDPCATAWKKLPPRYRKPINFGAVSFKPETLFKLKCNQYKDQLASAIRQPLVDARAAAQGAVKSRYNAALNGLRNAFLSWAAEIARDQILPALPPEEQARYDPNSPLVQQKAQEWLDDPRREIGTYVSAFVGEHAPRVGDAYAAYADLVSGQSKEILDGLNGILAKARARISQIVQVRADADASPDTPIGDILKKNGLSGRYIDKFKGYEGRIRALDKSYRIKDTVVIIVGSFQTDDPRAKIDGLFELIDAVSGIAAESKIPMVALFGDIVNAYAQVAKEMMAKIDGLAEMLKKRGGYCIGTGAAGDDRRSVILSERGITACPLAFDTTPWKNIYENIDPPGGHLFFWIGARFIDGNPQGGGKTGVQETIKLMKAASILGYTVNTGDLAAIAAVYNTPFAGGIPELVAEARQVIAEIAAAARRVNGAAGIAGSCSRNAIITQVESMTGMNLKAFLDEVQTDGERRLMTSYAASYVAMTGGLGKAGGKRAGAYDRYRTIWRSIRNVHVETIFGEVRDIGNSSAACAKCAGADLSVRVSGGDEVRSCETWKADDKGKFKVHVVATSSNASASLSAEVKGARSQILSVSLTKGISTALLLIKFDDEKEEKEDQGDPQACDKAKARIATATTDAQNGNIAAARQKLDAAAKLNCKSVDIEGAIGRITQIGIAKAEAALGACRFKTSKNLIKDLPEGSRAPLAARWNKAYQTEGKARDLVKRAVGLEGQGKFGRAIGKLHEARNLDPCESTISAIDSAVVRIQDRIARTKASAAEAATDACKFKESRKLIKALPKGPQRAALVARWNKAYMTERKARDLIKSAKALENQGKSGRAVGKLHEARNLGPCRSTITAIDNAIVRADTKIAAIPNEKVWKLVGTRQNPNGYKGNFSESSREWKKVEEYSVAGSGLRFTFSWTDTRRQAVRVKDIEFNFKVRSIPGKITAGRPVKITLEGVAKNKVSRPYAETRVAEIWVRLTKDPKAGYLSGLKLGPDYSGKNKATVSVPVEFTVPTSAPNQFEIHFNIGKTAAYMVWVYRSQATN